MKRSPRLLPYCTLIAGFLGFLLRLWLFSGIDQNGLLPASHIAKPLLLILTFLFSVFLIFYVRRLNVTDFRSKQARFSLLRALGTAVGAAGIAYYCVTGILSHGDLFSFLTLAAGLCAAAGMLMLSYCRLKGKTPPLFPFCAAVLFFIFHTVSQCRIWGAEPQMQKYCFSLLSSVFLMLSIYHQAVFAVQGTGFRRLVFCNQAALFFCCLSVNNSPFYLPMAFWMAADLPTGQEG